jgi:hypothetical protein
MSPRRVKTVKVTHPYTIFVRGIGSRSIPIGKSSGGCSFFLSPNNSCFTAIYPNTTLEDVHAELQRRHTLPKGEGFRPYVFTTFGLRSRLLSWNERISSAGIKCLGHIVKPVFQLDAIS